MDAVNGSVPGQKEAKDRGIVFAARHGLQTACQNMTDMRSVAE
jgi:hypothetical protein